MYPLGILGSHNRVYSKCTQHLITGHIGVTCCLCSQCVHNVLTGYLGPCPQCGSDRFCPKAIFPVQVGKSIRQPISALDSHVLVGRNLMRVVQPRVRGPSHDLCAQMVNNCCPADLLMAWSYLHGSRVWTTWIRDGIQGCRRDTPPDRTRAVTVDEPFLPAVVLINFLKPI